MTAKRGAGHGAGNRAFLAVARRIGRGSLHAVLCGVLLSAGATAARPEAPMPMAVADFEYIDSSGEVRDQGVEHRRRLEAFMQAIRRDLDAGSRYHVVALSCEGGGCVADPARLPRLVESSRSAGARFLLVGGIHKESTLVLWAKVQVVDLQASKVVLDRLLTFRGDNDEAWRRAEAFISNDLKTADLVE